MTLRHVLIDVGILLVVLGKLTEYAAAQRAWFNEALFWVGIVISIIGLVSEVRGERYRAFQ